MRTLVGPLLTELAVALLAPTNLTVFDETRGYAAMFGVASTTFLISIPILRRMKLEGRSAR